MDPRVIFGLFKVAKFVAQNVNFEAGSSESNTANKTDQHVPVSKNSPNDLLIISKNTLLKTFKYQNEHDCIFSYAVKIREGIYFELLNGEEGPVSDFLVISEIVRTKEESFSVWKAANELFSACDKLRIANPNNDKHFKIQLRNGTLDKLIIIKDLQKYRVQNLVLFPMLLQRVIGQIVRNYEETVEIARANFE